MDGKARYQLIQHLDETLLKGGVILSEWCVFIVREADVAFTEGADLASILTAMAGIETYLRSEYAITGKERLCDLIDMADFDPELKDVLHRLRKYRNRWVHVDDPWNDAALLENPGQFARELEEHAALATTALRHVLYENQWV